MKKIVSGEYSGRPVFVSDEEVSELDVRDSVVLIWSEESGIAPDLFKTLVTRGAIAVWVGGSLSNESFESLLELLSTLQTDNHVMSGITEATIATDALDDFLATAMPDPRKLDEWKSYDLIIMGAHKVSALLTAYLNENYPTKAG